MLKTTPRILKSLASGNTFEDDGLQNEETCYSSLLRAIYTESRFLPNESEPGLYRYRSWLPIDRVLDGSAAPVSYWSEGLADHLELNKLIITFSGYWPERGVHMKTGTFKECEAYSVCARFPIDNGRLVVASAGNTARAFIRAASENNIPILIVIPEKYINNLYTISSVMDCVRVIAVGSSGDYYDAISLANKICEFPGFINEGGAKNVARRDGMGTTVLSAAELADAIPDWYVQAIGSGTGAIAAHEANLRLNGCGAYPARNMRLLLTQNHPFTPITDAWARRSKTLAVLDEVEAKRQIDEIDAKVLSNRMPPYSITGGLYDALCASDGIVDSVTNDEIRSGIALFEDTEGCDICPEAGAALAVLIKTLERGIIKKDELVMLNITGGGIHGIWRDLQPRQVLPDIIVKPGDVVTEKEITDR